MVVDNFPTKIFVVFVNYQTLSDNLSALTENVTDNYHNELLKDYCTYISNLQSVIDKKTEGEYFFCDDYEKLKELGIHDVCGKRNMQTIYNELVERITQSGITVVNNSNDLKNGNVLVSWNYTNAPLIDVKFKHDEENIFIQIEGEQYRHAVEFFDKEIGHRINKKEKGFYPSEEGIKFLKDKYPKILGAEALGNYPFDATEFGMREKQGYCKYCNGKTLANGHISCWVYQWVKIPKGITKEDLINAICEDTKKIMEILTKNTATNTYSEY